MEGKNTGVSQCTKSIDNIQHSFKIKNTEQITIEGNDLNIIKGAFLTISRSTVELEMSLDFLSTHQLAGGRQPRRLGKGEKREGRGGSQAKMKTYQCSHSRAMKGLCSPQLTHPLPHFSKASCSCLEAGSGVH